MTKNEKSGRLYYRISGNEDACQNGQGYGFLWCVYAPAAVRGKQYLHPNSDLKGELVIKDGIAVIVSEAFHYYSGLTSIVLPESVTSIGSEAFRNCSSLTSVTIPNRYINDLSDQAKKLYKEAALSLWRDFLKKSQIQAVTDLMLKEYLEDKADYLLQKGYGNLLSVMLNMKKGSSLSSKISSAKTPEQAMKIIKSDEMKDLYKNIKGIRYSDKKIKR